MHRKTCKRTLNIKGVGLVIVVSVTGLARILGKSRITILRYEEKEILPEAPIKVKGNRYYPLTLANRIAPIVRKFPVNTPPDADTIVMINRIFNEEKSKLLCQNQK